MARRADFFPMLISLTLTNFRGFANLDIPKLARVNLIGGVNNAGKTSILEAIYLLLERDAGKIHDLPSVFRAPSALDSERYFWKWIAKNRGDGSVTSISAQFQPGSGVQVFISLSSPLASAPGQLYVKLENRSFSLKLFGGAHPQTLPGVSSFSPRPTDPTEDARVYTEALAITLSNEEKIESLVHEIDDRVKRVRPLADPKTNKSVLHVGLSSSETFPATQLGQGFNRLLRIYSALFAAEAKVFLIDEIETGLHHSVLPTIWKGLAAVARQEDVQIFATTHSREAILAAHRVFSAEPQYDFAYHRLERDATGDVQVVTYDQEALTGADEANFEVR